MDTDKKERAIVINEKIRWVMLVIILLSILPLLYINWRYIAYYPFLWFFYGIYSFVTGLYFKKTWSWTIYERIDGGEYKYLFLGVLKLGVILSLGFYLLNIKYNFGNLFLLFFIISIILIAFLSVWIKYWLKKGKRKNISLWKIPTL